MKKLKLLPFLLFIILLINACSKDDCPKGIKYTYTYYNISEDVKKTFPYQFKDTQVWINVNTNDTLRYILKDTVSSYDTTMVSPTDGCVENNYFYNQIFSYNFLCLSDSFLNYSHSYYYDIRQYLFFKKTNYYTYISTNDTIMNYSKVYKQVRDRKFFWENYENGIVRITVGSNKLYRIK